jgi:hypothetical protein
VHSAQLARAFAPLLGSPVAAAALLVLEKLAAAYLDGSLALSATPSPAPAAPLAVPADEDLPAPGGPVAVSAAPADAALVRTPLALPVAVAMRGFPSAGADAAGPAAADGPTDDTAHDSVDGGGSGFSYAPTVPPLQLAPPLRPDSHTSGFSALEMDADLGPAAPASAGSTSGKVVPKDSLYGETLAAWEALSADADSADTAARAQRSLLFLPALDRS